MHFLEDWLQAEREEKRDQGVALLLAGNRLQCAFLLFCHKCTGWSADCW